MNKVVIIGNGFDLHHGLETKFLHFIEKDDNEETYKEFKQLLLQGFNNHPISCVQVNWDNKVDWNKLEEYLKLACVVKGEYDPNGDESYYNDYDLNKCGFYEFKLNFLKYLKDEEEKFLKENNTQNDVIKNELENASIIVTYNYTNLISSFYNIDEKKIKYINGNGKNNHMIIGYEKQLEIDYIKPLRLDGDPKGISNQLAKVEIRGQINNNFSFNDISESIKEVIIIGQSLGTTDNDDWEILKNKINLETDIKIYVYDRSDITRYKQRLGDIGINNKVSFIDYGGKKIKE